MSTRQHPITEAIAAFVTEASVGEVRDELFERATRGLVDTVGVAIAARHEPAVVRVQDGLAREMQSGNSTVLPTGQRTSEIYAALVNGVASHALDLDDVADPMYGHPSAVMFPALLAVAEGEAAAGASVLEAYAIGFQVCLAIAKGLPIRRHYSEGWHSTATVGVIGATAGLSRLLGLSQTEVRHALGMAASMASGSRQNFGTMTKPLHPGLAGRSAITAVRLAQSGFTADAAQLEAPLGYFAMFGVDSDLSAVQKGLMEPWSLVSEGLNVKKYPCCYNTHRTADATLMLAEQIDVSGDEISKITLTMEPGGFDPLIHHRPTNGLEAKFSGEYVVATGLIDKRIGLDSFTDEAARRPSVQELLRKVDVSESPTPPFGETSYEFAYATVEIQSKKSILRERVDIPKGDARAPLDDAELEAKFRDCIAYSGVDWDAGGLVEELRSIGAVDRLTGFNHLVERELESVRSGV